MTFDLQRYMLKDSDFGERAGPALQYILKRNPHNHFGAEMRLYLLCQVHVSLCLSLPPSLLQLFIAQQVKERSQAIWGGEEGLERERKRRALQAERRRERKYAKEIKREMRMIVLTFRHSMSAY